jgi:glycosyltransferase involved in cell wall biosynthesis
VRILFFTRYDRLGASSRLRSFQYLPILRARGFEVEVSPLFSNVYVEELQDGVRAFSEIIRCYFKRLRAMLVSGGYDLVWIEKECLPWLPSWVERLLLLSRVPLVLDYDDAVFHQYDGHGHWVIRQLLSNKHRQLIRRAEAVIAGNEYLAEYAHNSGAQRVEILPTAIDLGRYSKKVEDSNDEGVSTVGVVWIGQRSTSKFLRPLAPLIERLSAEGKARFVAIGVNADNFALPMTSVPWSEETEVRSIMSNDIGIMPLTDSPFERGKCGYKLIQYMACGLPVIASPVGVNKELVEHGVNGYLADSLEAWEASLRSLIEDRNLRTRYGAAGRRKVESDYCIQVTGPVLVDLLEDVLAKRNRHRPEH